MQKFNYLTADKQGLFHHATQVLGLVVSEKATAAELRQAIAAALGDPLDRESQEKQLSVQVGHGSHPDKTDDIDNVHSLVEAFGPREKVVFHNQEGPLGSVKVELGLNGYMFKIPRELPVDIPKAVLDMVDTLVVKESYYDKEGKLHHRNRKRFNYSRVA